MEYIKRKRLLENYRSRSADTYGEITATTINVNVFLTSTYEDIGMYYNKDFEPFSDDFDGEFKLTREQAQEITPDNFNAEIDGRYPLTGLGDYNQGVFTITGETDERYLKSVGSYQVDVNNIPIYKPSLNMAGDITTTWDGVLSSIDGTINYVLGGNVNNNGGYTQDTGVKYTTINNRKTIYSNYMGGRRTISTSTLEANTSLLAIYKKEELLNIVQPPKVRNKVFISRGGEDIFERHSIMSEIKTRDDIDEYRNGYF
jgi:hypothetical protein